MDYEKKYKDALEKMREIITMDNKTVVPKEIGEYLFPELAETEDERIRKELVKYLTNELNNVEQLTPRTNEFERWIAWLEGQDAFLIDKGTQVSSIGKPSDDYDVDCFEITKQHPAEWSEEDDKLLNYAISMTDDAQVKRFLESLRYQPNLPSSLDDDSPKIKGWVARDEKDGRLDFFYKKPPIRGNKEWLPNGAGMISSIVFKYFCPDLKWEDEPIEVELTLKRI